MPTDKDSTTPRPKPKRDLDISKLSKVKNKKILRSFRKKAKAEPPPKLNINFRLLWLNAAIITVFVLLLFGPMLFANMAFNDLINIQIKSKAELPDGLILQIISDGLKHPLTQPFVQGTFAWDTLSFPGRPAWYHLVNITLHLVSCIYLSLFLFQVFIRLKEDGRIRFDPYKASLFIPLIFACHPLVSDTVSYISARSGLLVGCNAFLALNLFLLGFYAFDLGIVVFFYFLAALAICLGLLSSVQAIAIPIGAILLALLLKPPAIGWKAWFEEKWADFSIFTLISIGSTAVLFSPVPQMLDNGVDLPLLSRINDILLQANGLITYFLRFLVFPFGMVIDNPPFHEPNALSVTIGYAGLALLGVWGAVLIHFKTNPVCRFGGALALLVVLSNFLLHQHEIVAPQRFYLAIAGLAIVAGTMVLERVEINRKFLIRAGILIALMTGITIWRETSWNSDESFWQSALKMDANSPRIMGMLAHAYYGAGKTDEARKMAEAALKIDPACAPANEALGLTLRPTQIHKQVTADSRKAVLALQKCVETAKEQQTCEDKLSWYQYELADAARRAGEFETAQRAASDALKVRPGAAQLHLAMGEWYLSKSDFGNAFTELENGHQLDKQNPEFLEPLAKAGLGLEAPTTVAYAYSIAKEAARINSTPLRNMLAARASLMLGKTNEAYKYLSQFGPMNSPPEAQWLLAWAQRQSGHKDVYEKMSQAVLKIDPKIADRIPMKEIDMEQLRETLRRPTTPLKDNTVESLLNKKQKGKLEPFAGIEQSAKPGQNTQPSTAPGSQNQDKNQSQDKSKDQLKDQSTEKAGDQTTDKDPSTKIPLTSPGASKPASPFSSTVPERH
jgi:tetratricopeptide (TPR) repeat protein